MARFRNTTYTEHAPDAPNEKFGAGNSSMTRQLDLVDGSFDGRLQAAYDFCGYANVLSTGGSPVAYYISRVTPMPYPGLPPARILRAGPQAVQTPPDITRRFFVHAISRTEQLGQQQGVDLNAVPGGTAAANYPRARLTCEISTLPFWIKEDAAVQAATGPLTGFPDEGTALATGWQNSRYISRHLEEFSRIVKIPYGRMKVGGNINQVAIPRREGGANVTYTWFRVPLEGIGGAPPGVNFANIGSAEGSINANAFDAFPANTLYFDTMKTREYQGAFGEFLADVTFNMIFLPHPSTGANVGQPFPGFPNGIGPAAGFPLGWNFVFDIVAGKADYYQATSTGGQVPFQTSDFTALFRP